MENTQIYLSVGSVQTYRWNDERVTLQLLLLLRLFIESHLLDFYMNIFLLHLFTVSSGIHYNFCTFAVVQAKNLT